MPLPALLVGQSQDPFHPGRAIAIPPDALRRHFAAFGASGCGKSTLLRNQAALLIASGNGVTVIDPHSQLVDEILENHIPRHLTNQIVYMNPKDQARAFAINMLDCKRPALRDLVVANAMTVFQKLWAGAWGDRMADILRNSLHILIEQPQPVSILAVTTLLTDPAYRAQALKRATNPVALEFFHKTFDRWTVSQREEYISPVLNKVRAFATNSLIRAVIGQPRSSIDFRKAIDERKIILCDLSSGAIGAPNAMLLGSLIVMMIKMAALSRSDILEAERVPHVVIAEEAQNYIGDFESILSQTRKFNLILSTAWQTAESLTREIAAAIFGNAGNLVGFRVSNSDAERLRDEFAVHFPGADIQDLPDRTAYIRTLACDEKGCRPTEVERVAIYPPCKTPGAEWRSKIERASNEQYTRPRVDVDREITKFLLHPTRNAVAATLPRKKTR